MMRKLRKSMKPGSTPRGLDNTIAYLPLRENEIRLLTIGPQEGTAGRNSIATTLANFRLLDSPLYTAISWMWGPPGETITIYVNGFPFQVQRKLGRILQHLQRPNQSRTVWIDAICIDQNNILERGHQVKLMGSIYSQANYVIAFILADRSADQTPMRNQASEFHRILLEGKSALSTYQHRLIFGNRYFTRRWIIQEITMAQSVLINCEGYQFPLSSISGALEIGQLKPADDDVKACQHFTHSELQAEKRAIQLCYGIQARSELLEELLYAHESAECSDFHDKVFALISLAAKTHVVPDYTTNRGQLVFEVLRATCDHEGLSAFRTLSFTSFLADHLGAKAEDLRSHVLGSNREYESARFLIRGIVRGSVTDLQPNAFAEEVALRNRHRMPSLFVRRRLSLRSASHWDDVFEEDEEPLLEFARYTDALQTRPTASISGDDQYVFSFRGNNLREVEMELSADAAPPAYAGRSEGPLFIGLASTKVEISDEIWQFERTPVAVIARKSKDGHDIVGRAFLLSDLSFTSHASPKSIKQPFSQEELVWVKDGTQHLRHTPPISADLRGLYELYSCVSFDP